MGTWAEDFRYLNSRLATIEQQIAEVRAIRKLNQRPEDARKDKALARAEHLFSCELESVECAMMQAMKNRPMN